MASGNSQLMQLPGLQSQNICRVILTTEQDHLFRQGFAMFARRLQSVW
jgi:hypothetical protein